MSKNGVLVLTGLMRRLLRPGFAMLVVNVLPLHAEPFELSDQALDRITAAGASALADASADAFGIGAPALSDAVTEVSVSPGSAAGEMTFHAVGSDGGFGAGGASVWSVDDALTGAVDASADVATLEYTPVHGDAGAALRAGAGALDLSGAATAGGGDAFTSSAASISGGGMVGVGLAENTSLAGAATASRTGASLCVGTCQPTMTLRASGEGADVSSAVVAADGAFAMDRVRIVSGGSAEAVAASEEGASAARLSHTAYRSGAALVVRMGASAELNGEILAAPSATTEIRVLGGAPNVRMLLDESRSWSAPAEAGPAVRSSSTVLMLDRGARAALWKATR